MKDATTVRKGRRREGELSVRDREVFDHLRASGRPLSAYELVELMRPQGVRAPTTVYRALHQLVRLGLAHRLESLNAFVTCAHDGDHDGVVFAICETCGGVTEFTEACVAQHLSAWAKAAQFSVETATLELRGRCRTCVHQAAPKIG